MIKVSIKSLLFELIEYGDSNYVKDLEDRKLVIGYYYFINKVIILWYSKEQKIVLISMKETKYIDLGHTTRKIIWLKRFFNELQIEKLISNVTLYSNNEISIILMKNVKS